MRLVENRPDEVDGGWGASPTGEIKGARSGSFESAGHNMSAVDIMRAKLVTGRAVLDIPEPGWLIRDVIPLASLVVPYGPPKSGKSFVALDQALSVSTGRPWAPSTDRLWGGGYDVEQGPVMYIVGEGTGGLAKRVRAWLELHEVTDPGDIHWLTRPVNLLDAVEVATVVAVAKDIRPVLVVFDTLARCSLGAEENSAKDMGRVVAALDQVKEATGAAVMPVHHTGKDATKGMRGSTAVLGAADATYEITRDGKTVKWKPVEMKDAEAPRPLAFTMVATAGSVALSAGETVTAVPDSVWEVREALGTIDMGDGVASTVWQKACVDIVAESTFYRHRKWLVDNGLVQNVGGKSPRYSMTVEGAS